MILEFTVPGEPKGKGRPRFNPKSPHARPRTPEDTLLYENWIGWEFQQQCHEIFPEKEPILMEITAFYSIPASASNKKRLAMKEGKIRPTKKPDLDNVVKIYADALNRIAYHDDAQVIRIVCEKYYAAKPYVMVRLSSLMEEIQDERDGGTGVDG